MKNTTFSFFMLMILWLSSCNKKEAGPGPSPAAIAGTWLKTAETANSQNLWCLYYYDTCALDDAWRFERDGSYVVIDTGMTCAAAAPQGGSWQLEGERLRIDSTVYEVTRCDEELWLQGTRTMNGFVVRHEQRFRRP
jgi:hypothetical protein